MSKNSHRETPTKRTNPSGKKVWIARYTDRQGRRKSAGTFVLQRDAQDAIDAAYGRPGEMRSVGGYFETWLKLHPRASRTAESYDLRVRRVLNVEIEGLPLRDWAICDLTRRHTSMLIDHLLTEQKRAAEGTRGILRVLSAMTEDAIHDQLAETNPFMGVKVRSSDPRVTKAPKEIRVFTFKHMHAFAQAGGKWEAMLRTPADTGIRLGELLALHRSDYDAKNGIFHVRRTAYRGKIIDGTKVDHGQSAAGRVVPCPPGLARLIRMMPKRIDTPLLFSTQSGTLWLESNFRRTVWKKAQEKSGLDIRPHEMRHSFISLMRANPAVDDADLAAMSGHTVLTMLSRYTHPLDKSMDAVRKAIG